MNGATDISTTPATEAIPLLLEEHGGRIYSLGLRLCGDAADAQDLVQETFLNAYRHWHGFEGRAQASTWLYTIAARACQRMHRKRAGEPDRMDSLDDLLPSRQRGVPDTSLLGPGADDDPETEHLRREAQRRVERALAEVPAHFRLPLVLKELAELSLSEIAAVLGLKEATVKTRIHRARLALRKALAEGLPERPAAAPSHERRVCLDLLRAKQEAMDRGAHLPVADAELCERCRALFETLDLARDACVALGQGELPAPVQRVVLADLAREAAGEQGRGNGDGHGG
jgi:RNA polymerase sigma-70 factor (ECF subfamily)